MTGVQISKVASCPFGTSELCRLRDALWKLVLGPHRWNHMPQPSELLEQKRMVREQQDGYAVHTSRLLVGSDTLRCT